MARIADEVLSGAAVIVCVAPLMVTLLTLMSKQDPETSVMSEPSVYVP